MKSLSHIRLIAAKDLKLFVTDRIALGAFLLFPFLFVALFSFVLGGVGAQDERLTLHLVSEEDATGISHHIIEAIKTDEPDDLEPGELVIIEVEDYETAYRSVARNESQGFLLFPEDFSDGLRLGYGSTIEVVVDPEATYDRAALNSIAEMIAFQLGMQQVAGDAITGFTLEGWLSSRDMDRISEETPALLAAHSGVPMRPSLITYEVEKVGEVVAEEPTTYVIPGYLVMFVFMAAAFSAETIVRERQNQTLERLLAASVGRGSILSGTFAGIAAKGLVQIAVFWIAGVLVFGLDLGYSPGAVMVLSFLMIIMSSAFALMLATLVATQRAASSIALVTSLVLAPLGGCWWPLFITPRWMQFIAKLTPHGWATTGFNKLLVFSADFGAVIPEMVALLAFALAFATVAVMRFRTSAV